VIRALAAAGGALALAATGCGTTHDTASPESATPAQAHRLLVARLRKKQLAFRWVACVRDRRSFRGARIVRCNVNFGEPHIVQYCSVLERGRLVTDHDDAAIPCGRPS
jgi:hypothetical protein